MTTPAPSVPPQWPYFYPPSTEYSPNSADILSALQRQSISDSITGVNKNVYDRSESLGNGLDTINKNIYDSTTGLRATVETHTLGLRDAVERTGLVNSHAVERNSGLISMAVERNGATNKESQ